MATVATTATGLLPAANATVACATAGYEKIGIRLSGTFTGTVTFQGSVDGVTWDTLTVSTLAGTGVTTATAAGQWTGACAGLTSERCAMTSYTSGTCDVYLTAI